MDDLPSLGLTPGHVSICARSRMRLRCDSGTCTGRPCVPGADKNCCVSNTVVGCELCEKGKCVVWSCPSWCGVCEKRECVPDAEDKCVVSAQLCNPVPDLDLASVVINTAVKGVLTVSGHCNACLAKDPEAPKPKSEMILSCHDCSSKFHITCADHFGPKTSLEKIPKLQNKNNNFIFLCDPCSSRSETARADVERQRVQRLEGRLLLLEQLVSALPSISNKLDSLLDTQAKATDSPPVIVPSSQETDPSFPVVIDRPKAASSPWEVKDTPASFVIQPINDAAPLTIPQIGELAMANSIPLFSTRSDGENRTFISLPTSKKSKFAELVTKQIIDLNIVAEDSSGESGNGPPAPTVPVINDIKNKTPSVSIVGLDKEYSKDQFFDLIKAVNPRFGHLMTSDTFKVKAINTIRNKPGVYQAICGVSDDIRTIISKWGNKVHFGAGTHRVYDHFHVIRCSTCQGLNHFANDLDGKPRCMSPLTCLYCKGSHSSDTCPSKDNPDSHSCSNCSKNPEISPENSKHKASSYDCPSYKSAKDKMRSQIPWYKNNPKPRFL